jgi:hypothetical protein
LVSGLENPGQNLSPGYQIKDFVYQIHPMPETFLDCILLSDLKRPPKEGLLENKIVELSATEEFKSTIENIIETDFENPTPSSLSKEDLITALSDYSTSFDEEFFTQMEEYKNQVHHNKKIKITISNLFKSLNIISTRDLSNFDL